MRLATPVLLGLLVAPVAYPDSAPDVTMTWVEKYVTYSQDQDDRLTLTDVNFLAEVIFHGDRDWDAIRAEFREQGAVKPLATYGGSDKRAFTNGEFYTRKSRSFDTLEALDRNHPPGSRYVWNLSGPAGTFALDPIRIGGPEGRTQVPKPSTIRLAQSGNRVQDHHAVDPSLDLTLSWDAFEGGAVLGDTEWRDFVFVLVSDCHGNVVYTAGAPPQDAGWLDYTKTSATVPAGRLQPGQPYVAFISVINLVDYNLSHGIDQFAANSFATELPIRTIGQAPPGTCTTDLKPAQYLWTRKTRGEAMESWPTLVEYY